VYASGFAYTEASKKLDVGVVLLAIRCDGFLLRYFPSRFAIQGQRFELARRQPTCFGRLAAFERAEVSE
jgi:hypothetical protein